MSGCGWTNYLSSTLNASLILVDGFTLVVRDGAALLAVLGLALLLRHGDALLLALRVSTSAILAGPGGGQWALGEQKLLTWALGHTVRHSTGWQQNNSKYRKITSS